MKVNLLIAIAVIIFIKAVINLSKYVQTRILLQQFEVWLKDENSEYYQKKAVIIKLWTAAGIEDTVVPSVQKVEQYQSVQHLSVMKNFPNTSLNFPAHSFRMFDEAIGVYRLRMTESFSLIYWGELLIHLPKKFLIYLSVPAEHILVKLAQIVWWLGVGLWGFVKLIYQPELQKIVKKFLE